MDNTLFSIIITMIPVMSVIIAKILAPRIKANVDAKRLMDIKHWIKYAIALAERIIIGEKKGKERKAYVISFLMPILNKTKLKITPEQLDELIETIFKGFKSQQNQ